MEQADEGGLTSLPPVHRDLGPVPRVQVIATLSRAALLLPDVTAETLPSVKPEDDRFQKVARGSSIAGAVRLRGGPEWSFAGVQWPLGLIGNCSLHWLGDGKLYVYSN